MRLAFPTANLTRCGFVPVFLEIGHEGRAAGPDGVGIAAGALCLLEDIARGKFHMD
jgi:hypothetical protein